VIVGLDHSFLTIQDGGEDEARRFYGDVLGLEEIQRPKGLQRSGGVWFQAGGQELHLGTDDAHLPPRRPHPGFSGARWSSTRSRNGSPRTATTSSETSGSRAAGASTRATLSGTASSFWPTSRADL
jgi:catechol 2,3-dioxygenase-like lactoylglutathione lyase family enzyme